MARIQWEPLAIPDLGESALRAQAMAGSSIQSAFGGLTNLLGQWEGDRRQDVMADITRQQLSFKDPEAYAAALANGQINLQSEYLRPEDMMRVAGYQDTLVGRRNAQASFEQGQERFGWEKGDRARNESERTAMRAAYGEMLPALAAAREANDPAAVDRVLTELEAKYGQSISIDGLMRLTGAASSALEEGRSRDSFEMNKESHALAMERGELGLETDRTTFSQSQSDRSETRNIEALIASVSGIASPDILADKSPGGGAEMALQTAIEGGNFTAREIANVAARLGVQPPANVLAALQADDTPSETRPYNFQGGAPRGGFAGGARDSSRVLNYEAREAGFNALPDEIRTVGDVSDYARRMNRAGVASSATGTFQIVGQTLRGKNNVNGYAERVLGRNWRNTEWTPQVEDRIAEAIFNDHRNSATALRGQWVSLSPREAERVRQMPWSQARVIIAQKESGANLADARWGQSNRENAASLEATADARVSAGRSLRVSPANPTAFITEAQSVLGRTRHMLSRQGAAAGLDAAANYDATQAVNRLSNVAAADAIRPATARTPAGIFAAEGVSARRLADAVDQLKRDVGGNITSDTALRILADAKATGPNYGGQAMGNVRAIGGGIRIDMVRAAQIGRSLGAEGGANLSENAVNVRTGQARAQALATQFEQTLAQYKTSAEADARRLGPGQVSAMTRGFGERIVAINAQIDELTERGINNANSFEGRRPPVRPPANGRYMAVAPVARGPAAPPPAPTPQQLVGQRAARQVTVNRSFNAVAPGLGPLINMFWDRRERTRR